jgi:hypothetical protein
VRQEIKRDEEVAKRTHPRQILHASPPAPSSSVSANRSIRRTAGLQTGMSATFVRPGLTTFPFSIFGYVTTVDRSFKLTIYCHVISSLTSRRFLTLTVTLRPSSCLFSPTVLCCGPLRCVISDYLIFTARQWTWFSVNNHAFCALVPRIRCASTTSLLEIAINGCAMDPRNPLPENLMHGEDAGRHALSPSSDAVRSQSDLDLFSSVQSFS